MSELLLSDEEITEANRIPPEEYRAEPNWWLRVSRKVAKAQLKKLVKWGNEICDNGTHHAFHIKDERKYCSVCMGDFWRVLQEACGENQDRPAR